MSFILGIKSWCDDEHAERRVSTKTNIIFFFIISSEFFKSNILTLNIRDLVLKVMVTGGYT
jgi:hypothetical protein